MTVSFFLEHFFGSCSFSSGDPTPVKIVDGNHYIGGAERAGAGEYLQQDNHYIGGAEQAGAGEYQQGNLVGTTTYSTRTATANDFAYANSPFVPALPIDPNCPSANKLREKQIAD
ncbi:unnamed protein product [Amoebophrya sp. A25]|nr:unnamed protein product [Amoebophrya sp. A25]|eukprot:GSA25T00009584001.1